MATSDFEVVTRLKYSVLGQKPVVYEPGDIVQVDDVDAQDLLDHGVIAKPSQVVGNQPAAPVAPPVSAAGDPSITSDATPPVTPPTPQDIVQANQANDQSVVDAAALPPAAPTA